MPKNVQTFLEAALDGDVVLPAGDEKANISDFNTLCLTFSALNPAAYRFIWDGRCLEEGPVTHGGERLLGFSTRVQFLEPDLFVRQAKEMTDDLGFEFQKTVMASPFKLNTLIVRYQEVIRAYRAPSQELEDWEAGKTR